MLHGYNYPYVDFLKEINLVDANYPTTWLGRAWKRLIGKYYVIDDDGNKLHFELQESKRLVIDYDGVKSEGTWTIDEVFKIKGGGLRFDIPKICLTLNGCKYWIIFHMENVLVLLYSEKGLKNNCVFAVRYDIQHGFCKLPQNYEEIIGYIKTLVCSYKRNRTFALRFSRINIYLGQGWLIPIIITMLLMFFSPLGDWAESLFPNIGIGVNDVPFGYLLCSLFLIGCIILALNAFMSNAIERYKKKCKKN